MIFNISLTALDQFVTLFAVLVLAGKLLTLKGALSSSLLTAIAFIVLQCVGHVFWNLVSLLDFLPSVLLGGVYYIGLSLSNLFAIFLLCKLHNAAAVFYGKVTELIIKLFYGLALLQVVRFFDRYYGFDWLSDVYKYAIPAVNLVVLGLLVYSAFVRKINHEERV